MTRSVTELVVETVLSRGLRAGELTLVRRDGTSRVVSGAGPGPRATVVLADRSASRRVVTGGALGMAQGYLDGAWDSPDLQAVLDLGVANMDTEPRTRVTPLTPVTRAWHAMRDNDLKGSKRNIEHHYDLGNDFYRLWLDDTMAYSSALFEDPREPGDLGVAQRRKWDRMLELIQPGSRDHILEIGCGWGGFAIHAAREAGCRVTGITLSDSQHEWAVNAVREAGLDGRVDIRLQDYRHVPEQYTRIASIEMFEAVGERWWPVFFRKVRELLSAGGVAALQTITIEDSRFDDYRAHPDFIQRHVFPGGMLPSPERFGLAVVDAGLTPRDPHFFGRCYAATLAEWTKRFEASLPAVRALGFDDRFIRLWRYYLAYCQAGFKAGTIDVMQVRLEP